MTGHEGTADHRAAPRSLATAPIRQAGNPTAGHYGHHRSFP